MSQRRCSNHGHQTNQLLCNEILSCDNEIRYVAIYDYGELYEKMKPGINNYLTKEETEVSLSQAIYRWSTRKKTISKQTVIYKFYHSLYL